MVTHDKNISRDHCNKKAVDVSVCLTDSKYLHKFKRYEISCFIFRVVFYWTNGFLRKGMCNTCENQHFAKKIKKCAIETVGKVKKMGHGLNSPIPLVGRVIEKTVQCCSEWSPVSGNISAATGVISSRMRIEYVGYER